MSAAIQAREPVAARKPTTIVPCPMSREQYDRIDAVNFSTLKLVADSPKHYQHGLANPREQTAPMMLGSATHTAVLEPDKFALEYAVFTGPRRSGKDWDAFEAANATRTILKVNEYEQMLAIRDAVRSHPLAAPYLQNGGAELSFTWIDEPTGLLCKGRVDWLGAALVDLKTTRSTKAAMFGAQAARMSYHVQAAHYLAGLRAHRYDVPVKIVAVESAAPHDVAVFDVDEHALYAGEEERRELLNRVKFCRTSGRWPGRYENEMPLELPKWAFPDDDDDLSDLGANFAPSFEE